MKNQDIAINNIAQAIYNAFGSEPMGAISDHNTVTALLRISKSIDRLADNIDTLSTVMHSAKENNDE